MVVRHRRGAPASVLRYFKRLLNDAGPATEVDLAGHVFSLIDLLVGSSSS
jgi:molecular chaperone DnaK